MTSHEDPLPPMPPGWMPATEEQVASLREHINRQMLPIGLDLAYLARCGALAGVAEVIAERRRQVEQGATAKQDDQLTHGELTAYAERRIRLGKLRQAAALLAAEIDRLKREGERS
jgi:hypothetical protein